MTFHSRSCPSDSTRSSSQARTVGSVLKYQHESRKLKVTLPFGPMTVNSMYRTVIKRGYPVVIISSAGRAYRKRVAAILDPCQAFYSEDERVRVVIDVWRPDRRKFDSDNVIKPLLDCLQRSDILDDDKSVYQLAVNKHDYDENKPDGETWIDISPVCP